MSGGEEAGALKLLVAMLTLAALLSMSGGYITLPGGPVYIEEAGLYINASGGDYFVKAYQDGFRLVILSKPNPVYATVRVQGVQVNVTLAAAACRVEWLHQNTSGGVVAITEAPPGSTTVTLTVEAWRSLGLSCGGGVEVLIISGPGAGHEAPELTPAYPPAPQGSGCGGCPGGLQGAAVLASVALAVSVVAWLVERRVGGGGEGPT